MEKAIGKNVEDASTLDTFSLEMFENIAYVMAKHAGHVKRLVEKNAVITSLNAAYL